MSPSTPVYAIPYLTPASRASEIAAISRAQAEAVEAALRNTGATPLGSDLASLIARINALEASSIRPRTGMQAMNGYEIGAGSVFAQLGSLVVLNISLFKNTGIDQSDCLRIPAESAPPSSITFQGVASDGGAAATHTIVLSQNGIFHNWSASKLNRRLSFNLVWKVGV